MNKIHNNLNIENLMKTKWFKQFDEYQQEEILKGLKDNLDVSIYAKIEFDWSQMEEIRLGLEKNIDVSIYAKPEYSWRIMRKIRTHLLKRSTLK